MKKLVLGFIIVLLLVSGTVFAGNGDLIVDGNLGVGTTTPSINVHVQKAADAIVGLRIENPSITGANASSAQEQIAFGPSGSEHLMLQALSDSHPTMPNTALLNAYANDFFVRTNAKNVLKVFRNGAVADTIVLNAGNVGIGTSTPAHKLQVCGASGCSYNEGGLAWINASSREYKENIRSLSAGKAMEVLSDLDPVTFKYKAVPDQTHVGFIAEDVPDLVAMKDRKGLSAMDIVAVLTKVVQEQQKEIEQLKSEMAKMKGKERI